VDSISSRRNLEEQTITDRSRYYCNHDEFEHKEFDYNDYKYIDSLKTCFGVDWVEQGKVGIPKD
jgi:hypothetical protein